MKKHLLIITVVMSTIMGTASADTTLNSSADKLSYALAYKTGQAMKMHGVDINAAVFSSALETGYQGKQPTMSEQDMQASIAAMQKQMVEKSQVAYKALADKNAAAGKDFLANNAKKAGVITTASGLQYKVLQSGSGTSPTPTDTVTVNYGGSLLNGQVFDSSYQRKKPETFKVNQVIKGWQEALTKMQPGATWMIYIPADLAYGEQGAAGKIGPNETLIFKVNLISVNK